MDKRDQNLYGKEGVDMLAAERQSKIVELVQRKGSVQVEELAQELNVSAMTIRRDLLKLQKEDVLQRCHGGAVAKHEITYEEKQTSCMDAKKRLAAIGASFVGSGDTVFLDAGTTVFEVARLIKDIPEIMVVTNDLEIAQLLKNSEAELFICGGQVQKSTGSMFGHYATQMLEDFKFDIGFFGAASINEDFEVMTPTIDKMWLKRKTQNQCRKSYLIVDQSKFGRQAMSRINHLGDYTGIVTDKEFDEEEQEKLRKLHAVIIC